MIIPGHGNNMATRGTIPQLMLGTSSKKLSHNTMHLTIHGMKNHSTDRTKKMNNGGTLSSIEEVDLTHQPDTETQVGEANPTIDKKSHNEYQYDH